MTETPTFTIFTTYDPRPIALHADRWGVRGNRVYFLRGTMDEPWYDLRCSDLLYIRRNR